MTYKTPRRRTTLQFLHIFLMDARTFMSVPGTTQRRLYPRKFDFSMSLAY